MQVLKYISSVSVPVAWLQLILLSGYHGATISIMFMHIIYKRFMGGLLLTLVIATGFGTGFLIISYTGASLTFGDAVRLLFRPLLMVLGEYDFNTLYEEHKASGGDYASLFYASFLLLSLALVGSLVLVNLILALILSDVNHLYSMCRIKELFRKARQVVFYEKMSKLLCGGDRYG